MAGQQYYKHTAIGYSRYMWGSSLLGSGCLVRHFYNIVGEMSFELISVTFFDLSWDIETSSLFRYFIPSLFVLNIGDIHHPSLKCLDSEAQPENWTDLDVFGVISMSLEAISSCCSHPLYLDLSDTLRSYPTQSSVW